jgi:aminoglycoside 3-N-acetyltransferase
LGIVAGMTVMVHSSLGRIGWTVGGPVTVIRALLQAVGPHGTVAMPAESAGVSDPNGWNDPRVKLEWHDTVRAHLPVFDPLTTPTTMGAIPEAFRTLPATVRSNHPLVSVCANGQLAQEITKHHALSFSEGLGTPFEKLYLLDAFTLLLGVGFDRCTSLHYAESLIPSRRTATSLFPIMQNGARIWMEVPDMAADDGVHFPVVGAKFVTEREVRVGRVGCTDAAFFSTRKLVDFAKDYFTQVLGTHPATPA